MLDDNRIAEIDVTMNRVRIIDTDIGEKIAEWRKLGIAVGQEGKRTYYRDKFFLVHLPSVKGGFEIVVYPFGYIDEAGVQHILPDCSFWDCLEENVSDGETLKWTDIATDQKKKGKGRPFSIRPVDLRLLMAPKKTES